ncbi:MAG TPA: hypothetical protein VMV81_02385, partial [Phycisphaerae bacterium]|nr:hypothetical protein [Phycisphaerae bacterium]
MKSSKDGKTARPFATATARRRRTLRITVLMAMSAGFIAFTVSWASPPVPHEFISLPVLANAALSVADEPVMAQNPEPMLKENTLLASAAYSRRSTEALDVAEDLPLSLMAFADEPGTPSPSSKPARRRDDTMIDSVQSRNEKSEQLIVARNSSAVINLKQQADGVEISDPAIADVV